jgi:hypothetical protein
MRDIDLARLASQVYEKWDHIVGDIPIAIYRDLNGHQAVAIQGTRTKWECLTDLHFWPRYSRKLGWLHAGIECRGIQIAEYLKTVLDVTKPLLAFGHSLGAALAAVVATLWPCQPSTAVSFEPPAIAWFGSFVRTIQRLGVICRGYWHADDPVPAQPPWWIGFRRHCGLAHFGLDEPDIESHELDDRWFKAAQYCPQMMEDRP